MRKVAIKFAAIGLIAILCAALLECLCTAAAWWKYGTINVQELNDADRGLTAAVAPKDAAFAETVVSDRYLGITSNIEMRVSNWRMNGVENFPVKHDPSKFTILLTGASVAQLLGIAGPPIGPNDLDSSLAALSFGDRDVVILNTAVGATTQPRQAISLLLYGDVIDAVICLDGMNESRYVGRGEGSAKLGSPGAWFRDNSLMSQNFDSVGHEWLSNRLRKLSGSYPSRALFYLTKAMRNGLQPDEADTLKHFKQQWKLPENWTQEQYIEWNMERYRYCIRSMHALAAARGLREAYFIQPTPALRKTLTDDELRVAGNLEYGPSYQRMADTLVSLNREGIPVVSLLDAFSNQNGSVYIDSCHVTDEGNKLLSRRIADEVARLWQLERRK